MLDVYHGAARIDKLRPLLTRQGFFERLLKGEVWYFDGNMLWRRFGCTPMTITRIWCHRGERKSATGMLVTKKINHSAFACNRFWFEVHCSICNWCISSNSLRGNKEVMVFLLLNMGTVQPGLPDMQALRIWSSHIKPSICCRSTFHDGFPTKCSSRWLFDLFLGWFCNRTRFHTAPVDIVNTSLVFEP